MKLLCLVLLGILRNCTVPLHPAYKDLTPSYSIFPALYVHLCERVGLVTTTAGILTFSVISTQAMSADVLLMLFGMFIYFAFFVFYSLY